MHSPFIRYVYSDLNSKVLQVIPLACILTWLKIFLRINPMRILHSVKGTGWRFHGYGVLRFVNEIMF